MNKYLEIANIKKKTIILTICFLIVLGLLEVFSLSALIPVLQIVLDESAFLNSKYFVLLNSYYDFSKISNPNKFLYFFLSIFFIFIFIKNIGMVLLTHINNINILGIETRLSINLYEKYVNSSVILLSRKRSSEIIRNVISQSSLYANNFVFSLILIVTELFTFLVITAFLFYVYPKETIFSLSIFISISIIYVFFFKNTIIELSQNSEESYERRVRYLNYGIESIKEIKLYDFKDQFFRDYVVNSYKLMRNTKIISLIRVFPRHLFEIIAIFLLMIFIIISIQSEVSGEVLISKIAVFSYAGFRILPSINRTLVNINRFKMSLPIVKNIFKITDELDENYQKENFENLNKKINLNNFEKFKIKNLDFKYPNTDNYVFKNLNLTIEKGSLNFIYGPSGSGKSTLAEILIGLINVEKNKIFLDNFDLVKIKDEWQSIVSYVPQDIFLMDDTLKNNIVGNVDQKFREKDYAKVIELTQLNELDKLYHKNTIGEKGKKISFGQIKRIGIARASYKKKAKVLIFDEATANLDKKSELEIIEKIIILSENFTILFISHNMSLSKYFNNIFKLENKTIMKNNVK
jgi:ATP-binding cassette, subfamily B, bacterial PglK